jgi:hypothetical protein
MEKVMEEYLKQLSPKEQQAYAIAKRNLGSSFNLSLSIGYLEWKKSLPVPSSDLQSTGTSSNSQSN